MHWKIRIRKANKNDIGSIKEIDDLYLEAKHSIDYFSNKIDNILVALDSEKVIGYVMYKEDEVLNLVILPDYRRKGIGKGLMEKIMKKSRRIVCRTRENNKQALTFWKRIGFKEKGRIERYYKNGDNAIEMEWVI